METMQREFRGTFGDFLAIKRKEADLTIKDMANRLKISAAYYSYFESGDRKAPERDVQDRIAEILELTTAERLLLKVKSREIILHLRRRAFARLCPATETRGGSFNPPLNKGSDRSLEGCHFTVQQCGVPPHPVIPSIGLPEMRGRSRTYVGYPMCTP